MCRPSFGGGFLAPPLRRRFVGQQSGDDILVYLASPLCIRLAGWRSVFLVSAAAASVMAAVWLCKCPRIAPAGAEKPAPAPAARAFPWSPTLAAHPFLHRSAGQPARRRDDMAALAAFGCVRARKRGLSILSGVVLPVFSIAAFQLVSLVYRRAIRNASWRTPASCLRAARCRRCCWRYFHTGGAALSVAAAALLTGCMHRVNLMLICMLPPYYAGYGRSISLVSGMFNACTYIGSAASAYGMAAFSESFGWDGTILLWLAVALAGGLLCFAFAKRWSGFAKRAAAEKL